MNHVWPWQLGSSCCAIGPPVHDPNGRRVLLWMRKSHQSAASFAGWRRWLPVRDFWRTREIANFPTSTSLQNVGRWRAVRRAQRLDQMQHEPHRPGDISSDLKVRQIVRLVKPF